MLRLLGLIVGLLSVLYFSDFDITIFGDSKSYLILFFILIVAGLVGGAPMSMKFTIGSIGGSLNETETLVAAKFYTIARNYCIGAGIIGAIMGWVLVLKNINEPAHIAPAMSISLLTPLYE